MAVGQGGLHLTQIWNERRAASRPYSIMYDCGGHGDTTALSRAVIKARLQLRVESQTRKLDLLFLSHLHDDHLNGFKRLTEGQRINIGTLILPYYDDMDIAHLIAKTAFETESLAAVFRMVDITNNIPKWFRDRGVDNILQITPGDGDFPTSRAKYVDLPAFPEIGAELYDDRPFEAILVEPKAVTRLNSTEQPKTAMSGAYIIIYEAGAVADWLLLPHVQAPRSLSGHDYTANLNRLNKLKADVDKALQPYRTALGFDFSISKVDDLLRDLLDAYSLFLAPSKWNETSLSLASGIPSGWQRRVYSRLWPESPPWTEVSDFQEGWIWLHTGDAHLSDKSCGEWLTAYGEIFSDVSIFQLPHHGSIANIGNEVIGALPPEALCYVTAKIGDAKHPSSMIVSKLNARGIEVWPVLTDAQTQILTRLAIYK